MSDESNSDKIVPHPYLAFVGSALRSIAASVPIAASAAQAWSEYESHRTVQRIQELLANLQAELDSLNRTAREHAAALERCQDFPELLEIAIDMVRKEFSESKRAKYARALAKFVATDVDQGHDDRIALLQSLDALTETDLRVLQLFRGKQQAAIGDLQWASLEFPGDESNQLWEVASHLSKLASRGLVYLISEWPSVAHVPRGLTLEAARLRELKYHLSPLGIRLIRALE